MSFNTVNCCFDLSFFEACMESLLSSPIMCLMVSDLPAGCMDLDIVRKVRDKFSCVHSDFFMLLIRRPLLFEQFHSGSSGVVYGNLTLGNRIYGLIASHFYDPLAETADVVDCLLPTLLACFYSLMIGMPDINGKPVKKSDRMLLFGSLFCRGFPVRQDYVWPRFVFPSDIAPLVCYGSTVLAVSYIRQPVLYDWKTEKVYLDVEKVEKSEIRVELNKALTEAVQIWAHGLNIDNYNYSEFGKEYTNTSIFDMLVKPYDHLNYEKCLSTTTQGPSPPNADSCCFVSSWVQIFDFAESVKVYLQSCAHLSTGFQRVPRQICQGGSAVENGEMTERTYLDCSFIPAKKDLLEKFPRRPSDFYSHIQLFYLQLLENGYGSESDKREYYAVKQRLINVMPRFGQSCELSMGWTSSRSFSSVCMLKMPHTH